MPLRDLVPDTSAADPWLYLDEQETHQEVWSMLSLLPHRHREILVRRYGLHGEPETHAEIAAGLDVGQERSTGCASSVACHWPPKAGTPGSRPGHSRAQRDGERSKLRGYHARSREETP